MVLYFRILEPSSLNIVNQHMNDKGITKTNLPFWYNVNGNEFVLKVSSRNCKCYVGFEKDAEYNIDAELKSKQLKNGYTCILQNIINTINKYINHNE